MFRELTDNGADGPGAVDQEPYSGRGFVQVVGFQGDKVHQHRLVTDESGGNMV